MQFGYFYNNRFGFYFKLPSGLGARFNAISKGCFVVKKVDNLGLETNIEYNNWGQVIKQTDPLGNTSANIYDGWGKLMISKTNLGGVTTYTYEKLIDSSTKAIQYAPDATPKETYTDKFGRHYKTRSRGFNGEAYTVPVPGGDMDVYYPAETNTHISVSTLYDILGRKTAESEPYLDQETPKWNVINYDDSVFPPVVTATSFNGKLMRTIMDGTTTLVEELNGNKRITKKTTDALGNVVSSEDKGGVIHFSFNASNQQISAQYANNTVTTEYDVWGRKSRFHDPSNGVYTYEYNGLGQIKKEISPKGYKEYTYNAKGQLINQVEKSNAAGVTDKSIDFSYNAKGQPENKTGTSNGKTYSTNLVYDTFGRLLENTENSNGKTYSQKDIIYDKLSRIVSYEKSIVSAGVTTKAVIENVYDAWSGVLSQVKDKATGKVLWKLKAAGADGRVMRAQLGETSISNQFDEDNFLSQTNHTSSKGLVFGSSYIFDGIKNELKERTRLGNFSQKEVFTYDDNNRLVRWTNPKTGGLSANKYDIQGRITENDQIGTIQFEDPAKVYQPTGAKLSTIGKQNYLNDKIRRIVYNENNDPVYIQSKKGDVRFEYGLTGARQIVMLGEDLSVENTQPSTIQYYSEDGSFEVVRNNTSGEEKHILYIGGIPYESNVVYLKDFTQSSGSYKFLHKDYLGSILAISDEEGNLVEEVHFDAWGLCTKWRKPGGLSDLAEGERLLNRGYTSHEHFEDIGIIHMNGRLYDPVLRRFLNADENIQDLYNTQNYNKYAYVLNNPLMYNDPSGEIIFAAGFFLTWLAPMIFGAIVGAAIGAVAYALSAAFSGDWSWGGFLKSIAFGALGGAIAGGLNPGMFSASGYSALKHLASGVFSSVMPPMNIKIGSFDFSISPSIAIGKGWGFGANISATFHAGDFSLSAGFGIMNYGAHAGSGVSGWEYRKSALFSYEGKAFSFKLGTNIWSLHSQKNGIIGFGSGDFSLTYENDGSPFAKGPKWSHLGDNNDRYRTAAMTIKVGNFHAGFNLFTGERTSDSYYENKGLDFDTMTQMQMGEILGYGDADGGDGSKLKYGLVEEKGPRYRLGAAYIGWKNYRIGIDSDRNVRHPIQNVAAHRWISPQPGFEVLSKNINPYLQYQTRNKFTSW